MLNIKCITIVSLGINARLVIHHLRFYVRVLKQFIFTSFVNFIVKLMITVTKQKLRTKYVFTHCNLDALENLIIRH